MTQNISSFKRFSKNKWSQEGKIQNSFHERKTIVNTATSKIINQQIKQLDNEYEILSNAEKKWALQH